MPCVGSFWIIIICCFFTNYIEGSKWRAENKFSGGNVIFITKQQNAESYQIKVISKTYFQKKSRLSLSISMPYTSELGIWLKICWNRKCKCSRVSHSSCILQTINCWLERNISPETTVSLPFRNVHFRRK